jgi:Fur family transcriptional regulator, peroxide stress response regulator
METQYRNSRQRQKILELLRCTKSHPTADWIYDRLKQEMPHLSLGTVYRNLRILERQGKLIKLTMGSSFDRFDGNIQPHYHITCRKCGRVDDVDLAQRHSIDQHAEAISGYRSVTHRIDFSGICSDCSRE